MVLVLGFGGCMVLVGWLIDDPDQVEVAVEAPFRVWVGESFELVARVHNRASEPQRLTVLKLTPGFTEGITIRSGRPPYYASNRNRFDGILRFDYDLELAPQAERTLRLQAVAVRAGDFSGEIEFCINDQVHCLSQVVRTLVVKPGEDAGTRPPAERPAGLPAESPSAGGAR